MAIPLPDAKGNSRIKYPFSVVMTPYGVYWYRSATVALASTVAVTL